MILSKAIEILEKHKSFLIEQVHKINGSEKGIEMFSDFLDESIDKIASIQFAIEILKSHPSCDP